MTSKYLVAEKFRSPQGEAHYTGTPMAFVRFVGCSVGKKICQHCDTSFDSMLMWRGGGEHTAHELIDWAFPYTHLCLTGGEPLDQDLIPFLEFPGMVHIETSGTVPIPEKLVVAANTWICVSPKPGWLEDNIELADEVKAIVPGLGINPPAGTRWPTLDDALRWARQGKIVYVQPRNAKMDVDKNNLMYVMDLIRDHPQLRLSVQLHKLLRVQ